MFLLLIFLIPDFTIGLNSLGMSVSKDLDLRGVCFSGVRGKRLGSGVDPRYIIEKAL